MPFPRFWNRLDPDWKQFFRGAVLLARNQDHLAAATVTFLGQFDAEFGSVAQGKDDGYMGRVHIKIRPVFKAGAGVRGGASAAHLADAERAHEGSAVGRAAADDFNIGCAAAEHLQITAYGEDGIQMTEKTAAACSASCFHGRPAISEAKMMAAAVALV